jgi:hypothetical protein
MATCPNKNSREWKEVLAAAQNNEKLAMELWVKRGYVDRVSLNQEDTSGLSQEEIKNLEKDQQEKEEEKTDLQILVERSKVHLRRRIKYLTSVIVKDRRVQSGELKKVIDNMEAVDEIESINEFIMEAYAKSESLMVNMEQIVEDIKDNPKDNSLIERLLEINIAVNGSEDILSEIADNKDIVDFFNKESEKRTKDGETEDSEEPTESIKEMLYKALANRKILKRRINVEAIPLIADWLLSARSSYATNAKRSYNNIKKDIEKQNKAFADGKMSKNRLDRILKRLDNNLNAAATAAITREDLIKTLREASREDGRLDFLIGPMISSPDTVIALVAKAIKDQLEKARLKDVVAKEIIGESFDTYKGFVSASRDNPQKFNEGIYEIIDERTNEKDENGNYIYREELHFVSKFDMKKFKSVERNWYKNNPEPLSKKKKASPLTTKEARAYSSWFVKRNNFYKTITKSKSEKDINKLDSQMIRQVENGIITQEEFDEWSRSNERKKQLSEPTNEFLSDKWKAMYNEKDEPINPMGEYHQQLTGTYYAAQENIPDSQRPGTRVPSVPKKDLERLLDKGVINLATTNVKEALKVQSYDTEFGELGLDDEGVQILPVFYTRFIDIADQSFDLASTVLIFNQMANKYQALNEVNGQISLVKSIMKNRKVPEFNQGGKRKIDAFANKFGLTEYLKQNGESFSKQHLDAFLDMVVYGEMQKVEMLGNISASKLTNTITSFSALTSIAADLLKGVANNLQGNIQLIIEAKGAEFFNGKNLRKGKALYAKGLPGMLSDFGKPTPISFMGRLNELYDPIQGDFQDNYGRLITASVANKLFRTNTLFFNQYFGEHELQTSTMLALMDATMVRDKETKEEITLFQAHEKYGVREAFDKIEWIDEDEKGNKKYKNFTEKDRRSFQDRLHALNKKMHGVYNSFDKGTIQRQSVGRLALMYRKHMYPGFMRRFQRVRFDEELGSEVEGYYRTFWQVFVRDLITYKRDIGKQWSTYTPHQKANIRRNLTEISIILSLMTVIILLSLMTDDDEEMKDNYAYNFILYEAIRMKTETSQYISFKDAWRTVKSPSAALSTLSRLIKFTGQIMPWNITEPYARKQGIWDKGDNKAWAYFIRLIGLPGYNIKPREAVKVYQSIGF